MSEFHFLRPDWFWLLLPVGLLLAWSWRQQLQSRSWQSVCDPQLLPHLLIGRSQRRQAWPQYLLLLSAFLAAVALAGPTWERQPSPVFRQQSALVILFDLSLSMNATDLKPNRLTRARMKIADILQQRREGQTSLVVFAGDAFTVSPLTDDNKTIAALLDSLEPGLMPVPGSRPELALHHGKKLLQQAGLAEGQLLLITDDDQPESAISAAEDLKQSGYQLSVLGIGTRDGAPIPLPEGGFFKDPAGQLVLPQLKPAVLAQLAQAGGGAYQTIRVDDRDIENLLRDSARKPFEAGEQQTDKFGDRWRESGAWLLWPLALLAACAFRRGWLTIIVLCSLLPSPAQAFDWQQLWRRPDQQGAKAFERGDYKAATERFENPRWQASSLYRDGQFAEAVKKLEKPETADDWYNKGNALAKSGQLAEALSAYDEALKIDPQDPDTLANQELVREALKQQQQEQQRNKNQEESSQESDETKQNKDSSEGQGEQQQSSEEQQKQEAEESPQAEQGQQDSSDKSRNQQEQEPSENAEAQKPAEGEEPEPSQDKISTKNVLDDKQPLSEEQRASQQWLERIPDDPGGLLRRKFLYQYRQRDQRQTSEKSW